MQAGELGKGYGHTNVEFFLNARKDANLDLCEALDAAGHVVPSQCGSLTQTLQALY